MKKNDRNSKNLRLLSEILGSTLRFRLVVIFFFIILISSLDFVILSLIFQFINSLVSQTEISKVGILRALGTVSPTLILPIMALVVCLKSASQYFLQLRTSLIFSLRESFVAVTFFKATLMEDIEARKNRESVESLFLLDRYVSQVFGHLRSLPYFLSDVASASVVIFGLFYFSPSVSLILIGIILSATILIFKVYSRKQQTLSLELLAVDRQATTIKIESQKLATELILGNRVDQTCEVLEKNQLNSKNIMGKISAFGLIPKYLLEITLLLSLAFIFSLNHTPSFLSTMAIIAAAAFRVVPMIGSIVSNVINLRSGLVTLNRLSEIVSTLGDLDLNLDNSRRAKPAKTLFSGDLRLQGVSFAYQSSNQSLFENLSLNFADSTTTLLTGVSGAGKTTFLHLILGLLKPSQGEIFLSGASGMHVMNDSIVGISFLQQGVALISGTVAENIVGSTLNGFSEEKIRKAIIDAGLESTVASLKDGFNTHVGEDANHFSAGERQRLGLARALYESPGLLILDEPTSNLDSDTESEIWRTLAALKGKMTIIIVSHRGVPKDVYDRELIFTKQGNLTVISG